MQSESAARTGTTPRIVARVEALARGITDAELRSALRARQLTRIAPGTYAEAAPYADLDEAMQHLHRVRAIAARSPDLVVSHQSAAAVHGLPLLGADLARVQLIRPGHGGNRRTAHRHVHAGALVQGARTVVDGIAVTVVARTVVDLARIATPGCAVVAGDAALRSGATDPADLLAALGDVVRLRGHPQAERVLSLLDGRSESPGESLLRLRLVASGQRPELQLDVLDEAGGFVGRVDAGFPDDGVLLEFDGAVKYGALLRPGQSATDVVIAEKRREERLTELGWLVLRASWADLYPRGGFVERVRSARAVRRRIVGAHGIRGSIRSATPIRVRIA